MMQPSRPKKVLRIEVENIPLADAPLEENSTAEQLKKWLGRESTLVYAPPLPERMVSGYPSHAFLGGMYQAYADHRPFCLSPEMIWQVIMQGFSIHLEQHPELITSRFPELKPPKNLEVWHPDIVLGDPQSPWHEAIAYTVENMKTYLGAEYVENLKINFSGSTQLEQTVGDLTIMNAHKHFFRYYVGAAICGIPTIMLEGEENDWDIILQRLNFLEQFDLFEWISKLKPIIQKIKESYTQEPDKDFWRHMFKVHRQDEYGSTHAIDGWITHFYPYDKAGNKITEDLIWSSGIGEALANLPGEKMTIEFTFLEKKTPAGPVVREIPMYFMVGFLGQSQDQESLCLRPEMGWYVARALPNPIIYEERGKGKISFYRALTEFPVEILDDPEAFDEIKLHFKDSIQYPHEISRVNCKRLVLMGKGGTLEDLRGLYEQLEKNETPDAPKVLCGLDRRDFQELYELFDMGLITEEEFNNNFR
jgi:hypothetical protein